MTRHKPKKSFFLKLRSLYLWHRYVGVTVAALAILLAFTGIMLNHTESLDLDTDYIESTLILDWYGIQAPEDIVSYQANTHTISQLDTQLYFDDRALDGQFGKLLGANYFDDTIIVAVGGDLLLLTDDGEVVERMTAQQGIPSGVKKIGLSRNRFVVDASHAIYTSDENFDDWIAALPTIQPDWSTRTTLPETEAKVLQQHFRAHVLPLERLVLDLHSGRLFGEIGVWVMDIAALMLIMLAGSGVWIWLGQRRKRKDHQQRRKQAES